ALWAIVMGPVLAVYAQSATGPLFCKLRRLNRPVRDLRLLNAVALILIVLGVAVQLTRIDTPATVSAAQAVYPSGAVGYLNRHVVPGQMFNSYAFGGYLIWHEFPRYHVFIDSRADTVYGARLLRDYLTVYRANPGWARVLSTYRIGWALVEPQAPIVQVLLASGWRLVYHDRVSDVVVHRPSLIQSTTTQP
ncbi:MAG TPA: hypothetical protein VFB34_11135, partial [Chloroflexota bacterium]|nr:hypothetical protein [Chloroflexota bacterium]